MRTCSLVLLWASLSLYVDTMSITRRTVVEMGEMEGEEEEDRDGGKGGKLLKRFKRGWMWNQFFLQEEYTGSDKQYIGKLQSDMDRGDGTLKYILSGDGAGDIFTIDENNGDLHANKRLDREEKAFYTLRATVVNKNTGMKLEPETEFIVKLHDINDNEPKFTKELYTARVPERSNIGIIRTALGPGEMDREKREHYQVVIEAKDMAGQRGGLTGTTTINITLTDVNDNPPRFSQSIYQFSVPESMKAGTPVGRITAVDKDLGKNAEMYYNVVGGDGLGMFDVITDKDSQEGIITVGKPLDYEKTRSYTLEIQVQNTQTLDTRFLGYLPTKDMATVRIGIEDVDEPPLFERASYVMEVKEDAAVGIAVGSVRATDPDGYNSPVRYSIDRRTDLDRLFNVHSGNGSIFITRPLDREEAAWHNISVIATEFNKPLQTSRVPVYIRLLDVNDNAPTFASFYETFVCEKTKAGQKIQTVSAVDADDPAGGHKFFFSLATEGAYRGNFTVRDNGDNTAGILTRRSSYSRLHKSVYLVPMVITDGDFPMQSSTGTLTVRVCTCDREGNMELCNAEAQTSSAGLKDVRDNVVSYNDEGGGEEDTQAFDIGALRNPEAIEESKQRRDIIPSDTLYPPLRRTAIPSRDNADVRDFINQRVQDNDNNPTAPPYDSLATYAYEGTGSVAESLSSLGSASSEGDQDYNYLSDWGPRFRKLADMYGAEDSDRDS
ncbi:unnamed protein product [Coregonus sp. 'balchen']|nr:unnamed protein product [Coregonus sp. 'balchen']